MTGWYFEEMGDKAVQNADLLTKHAFENDVATFVRETLQNANDAQSDETDEPVEVVYRLRKLTGSALDEFLDDLDWGDDGEGLYKHLRSAGEVENDRQLDQYLDHLRDSDELLLLSVEDRNTEGLDGEEVEDGTNYTSLIRDMGRSNKEATEGGSHGVGKTVLWAFSGISTVLFSSYPERDTANREAPRFVGRTLLPDHRDPETEQLYSGNGWYGKRDPDDPDGRYISIWGDTAKTEAQSLYSDHVPGQEATGTTATVVGFRDPTSEGYRDTDELLETFRKAIAEYFWPAIEQEELRVFLKGPDEENPTKVDPYEIEAVKPFIDCFRNRQNPDEDIQTRGNVVTEDITFDLPDKKAGPDPRTEPRGKVSVYAKSPSPGDDEGRRNQVAMFRGAGMVVEYVDMSGAASYGSDFYGLLVAGKARGWSDGEMELADPQVEELLRTSEPAAHDEWKGYKNSRLQSTYERGCATTVEDLTSSDLRQCLQGLVASQAAEEGGLIESMQRKIPQSGTGTQSSSSSTPSVRSADAFDADMSFTYSGGSWEFQGSLGPHSDEFDHWEATIEITTIGEENNQTGRIDIDECEITTGEAEKNTDDGVLTISANDSCQNLQLEGESISLGEFDPYSGRLGKSRLQIDGTVELEEGDQ